MAGFYDIFSTQIKKDETPILDVGLEAQEELFVNEYILNNYNPNFIGLEVDDPFSDIIPDPQQADINTEEDPMSMDNNALGSDGSTPFDGLIDEGVSDNPGDMFDPNAEQTEEQQAANDQIVVDREKLLRGAYNLGANIRKIFPKRFIELKEILQSNLSSMETLELTNEDEQDALKKIKLLMEEQVKNIDIFLDIIAEQPFDSIFRKYVEIFVNCLKLKQAFKLLIEEPQKGKNKKTVYKRGVTQS